MDPDAQPSNEYYFDVKSLMRPHTVFIVFEDVATSTGNMGFTIKLNRNFEGIPTGAGKFLERGTARL
jgi:hypothetical protein